MINIKNFTYHTNLAFYPQIINKKGFTKIYFKSFRDNFSPFENFPESDKIENLYKPQQNLIFEKNFCPLIDLKFSKKVNSLLFLSKISNFVYTGYLFSNILYIYFFNFNIFYIYSSSAFLLTTISVNYFFKPLVKRIVKEFKLCEDGKNVQIVTQVKSFKSDIRSLQKLSSSELILINNYFYLFKAIPFKVEIGENKGIYFLARDCRKNSEIINAIFNKSYIDLEKSISSKDLII